MNTENIFAFLDGKLTDDERKEFERIVELSPDLQNEIDEISFIRNISAELNQHYQIDRQRNWNELLKKIRIANHRVKLLHLARNTAAILIIPLLISTYILFGKVQETMNKPVELTELLSAPGIVSRVDLPDGSEVWLNSGSVLTYPTRFTDKREVLLKGEAYFKVASDRSNRFDVKTNDGLIISAFGTEFNINAYEGESNISATLVKGNIELLHPANNEIYNVKTNDQLIYNRENGKITSSAVHMPVVTGWKDGKMVFRRAGMEEIIRRLSRRFNVDIRLEGKELYGYEYSATFTHESLSEILHLLEKSAPIRCRIIEPKQTDDYSYTKRMVVISILNKR